MALAGSAVAVTMSRAAVITGQERARAIVLGGAVRVSGVTNALSAVTIAVVAGISADSGVVTLAIAASLSSRADTGSAGATSCGMKGKQETQKINLINCQKNTENRDTK